MNSNDTMVKELVTTKNMFKMENYGGKQWLEKLDVETDEKDSRFRTKYRFYGIDSKIGRVKKIDLNEI